MDAEAGSLTSFSKKKVFDASYSLRPGLLRPWVEGARPLLLGPLIYMAAKSRKRFVAFSISSAAVHLPKRIKFPTAGMQKKLLYIERTSTPSTTPQQ